MFRRSFFALTALFCTPMAFAGSVNYNLFLIPSNHIRAPLTQITQQITDVGLTPLYEQGYLPHITLYLTQYASSNLTKIEIEAKKLAAQWQRFPITLTALEQTKGNWLLLNIQDSNKLQRLADEATMALSPLRDPNATLPSWVKAYPDKIASFQRYGSPNVFAQFQPHVTLLPKSNEKKLSHFMSQYANHFQPITVSAIGIGIALDNTNGQAKHPIATYYFSK